ncbi:DMT family transporter [Candidatus Bealeia paramacronuclearis]|uniref:DMT family transporter n=1 Tax=Candidatus Bealeia paramacronuclearis TaxID=1921001 RepID=A0ABZ2C749_9PROT|nr:DMT family transporter [Candidatus Bealeia paramacronuclearis]
MTQMKNYIPAALAILGISLSPIFVKLSEVGVISTGFFRFFLALPFLWGWMIHEQSGAKVEHLPRSIKDYISLFLSGTFLGLDIIFWHWSLNNTHIANSMLLNNLTAILVALYAWLIWKEKITAFTVLGIFVASLGAIILVTDGGLITAL